LENLIQRACVLASGSVLLPGDLPFDQGGSDGEGRSKLERAAQRFINAAEEESVTPVDLAMRELVRSAMTASGNDSSAAAKLLGITATELKRHLPSKGKK
jgi:DNA-binding NtrC family response regulator